MTGQAEQQAVGGQLPSTAGPDELTRRITRTLRRLTRKASATHGRHYPGRHVVDLQGLASGTYTSSSTRPRWCARVFERSAPERVELVRLDRALR